MRLFEKTLQLKKFPIREAEVFYRKLAETAPVQFEEYQNKGRWEIVRYHFDKTPFYRDLLQGRMPLEWSDIPVLRKKDYQSDIGKLISSEFSLKNIYINNTSGSSGHPFFYARDRFSHALAWANIKMNYAQHGIEYDGKQARFYGIPLLPFGLAKERLKDMLANRVRFTVFDLSDHVLEKFLNKFRRIPFHYMYGYTSTIVLFARYIIQKGLVLKTLCPTLKGCIVTSEVVTEEDRAILGKAFGIPIINEYGASELGVIAIDDTAGDWLINDELLYVEIVDDNNKPVPDGEPGKLVITSLYNKAMPFIRYEIGDCGIIDPVRKGNRRILRQLLGRVNDFALLPSGKRSPGLTFYYISRSLMEQGGGITEFIIKQKTLQVFEFEYVAQEDLNDRQKRQVQEMMDLYLEPGLKPVFTRKEYIERPASGKIKHFYSELDIPVK